MSSISKQWTIEDDVLLGKLFGVMTHKSLGELLGRSEQSVRSRCWLLGFRKAFSDWSEGEIERLRQCYAAAGSVRSVNLDALAVEFGRDKANICRKARALGLTNRTRSFTDEQSSEMSERVKSWIEVNGHPRGATGMKHSAETRARMSEFMVKRCAATTKKQWAARGRKMRDTKIERYGVASLTFSMSENPYSRAQRGYIDDIPGIHFRSMWECNYARYLDWLKDQGEIVSWEYEPHAFVFHGVTRAPVTYTPDFLVTERDGSVVYHEVKGWMDSKSKSKLKRMKKYYPAVAVLVIDQPAYKAIARSVSAIVPFWGEPPKPKEKPKEKPE